MNIPIVNMRIALEKNAGAIGGAVKAVWKHPKITLAIIGTGAAGLGTLALADKIHDAYNISSEMRKRKVMNNQIEILNDILDSQRKLEPGNIPVIKKQKQIIEPLY